MAKLTSQALSKTFVPGKLILSGEHGVVHGAPALAATLTKGVTTTITREGTGSQLRFVLPELNVDETLSHADCLSLQETLLTRFQGFEAGRCPIQEVLSEPHHLVPFVVAQLFHMLKQPLPSGWVMEVTSDLPMGYGLGSSAAAILSVRDACLQAGQWALGYNDAFDLALTAEKLRHGHTSGLDLKVCEEKGCVWFHNAEVTAQPIPKGFLKSFWVNTGQPESTTGECVAHTTARFDQDDALLKAFANTTQAMGQAIAATNLDDVMATVRENHQLLCVAGVVPAAVQKFIGEVESLGGAAKISGAGSIAGDNAGCVWALLPEKREMAFAELCKEQDYPCEPLAF